ncbi:MAG: hypothetical protein ACI4UE_02885 [Candidatus Scatovivens sp.]
MKAKNNKKNIVIAIIAITTLIVLIIINILISNKDKSTELTNEEIVQIQKESTVSKLSEWGEKDRIEYYATNFLRYLEYGNYTKAYSCLYDEFKKKYFPTEQEFEEYVKQYLPKEIITEYENIERLDNTYVLWLNIKDAEGEKNDFSLNIVIRENDYDDFDLSFSVNSAIDANK